MAKTRKPIPKTQQEISNSLSTPYDKIGGDPNLAANNNNRANRLSWRGDSTKPFTVGLQDIDESIVYYFNKIIRPFVVQNGERIEVPIIYGSPERWKSVQKDGYYKDKNGAVMAPIIMFKRDEITKNRTIANKLDANNPQNFGIFEKKYTKANAYDNFSVLNNRVPVKEYIAVVYPDYVTISYSCVVSTYYVEQMNSIIEAINYASDSEWGDPERFKFRAMIDNFTNIVELSEGKERVAKTTFNIKLNGYIIPDIVQKSLVNFSKFNSKSKLIFSLEVVSDASFFEGDIKNGRIVTQEVTDRGAQRIASTTQENSNGTNIIS